MHVSMLRMTAASALSFALLLGTAGCQRQSSDVLGEAYVGPATVNLRRQLAQKNSAVAVLRHGDHLSILDVHRRFAKVRTDKGAEGWIDSFDLLTPEEMQRIRKERHAASLLPSEGRATAFEALNIHIDASRKSPAFAQIPEGGAVEVLAHRIAPKATGPIRGPSLVLQHPQQSSRKPRKQASSRSWRLPPAPPPPKPPENWRELSGEPPEAESTTDLKAQQNHGKAILKLQESQKPEVMEDWTLVRSKDNQCGWVLSRNLQISIPDEVAQYAEGKRITSYFDLGLVNDEEKGLKHNWLWTTSSAVQPYDFDGWRVFLWNRRRHRYETSYRQRDVEGYFPVHVDPAGSSAFGRTFELITKDEDGKFRMRTYLFDGVRVHLTATADYHPITPSVAPSEPAKEKIQAKASSSNWIAREWDTLRQRLGRSH
jgi:hypothetical protein